MDSENVNGVTCHEAGKILEKYSDGRASLKTIFMDYEGLMSPFILEAKKLGIEDPELQDKYICAFLAVKSKTIENGYHWLYVMRKLDSDTVYISDPYLENVFPYSKFKLPELDIVEVSIVVDAVTGGVRVYEPRFFPYALA